jgi:hypothetical protein
MTIYIATEVFGKGVKHVWACDDKADLFDYVSDTCAMKDANPLKSMSVSDLLACIYDDGPGFGSRQHRRVSRKEAIALIKKGAENDTFLEV